MIKFNGYYIFEPSLYQERKEWEPWYFAQAYLFTENKEVFTAFKYIKFKNDNSFVMTDFKRENGVYSYEINNNEICLRQNVTPEWESKFYYDKISDKEFVSRQTGEKIKFVPWDKE